MRWLKRLIGGANAVARRERAERELDEELRACLEAGVEEKMRRGLDREAATRAARIELGLVSVESVKDRVRDVGWESTWESVGVDIRYAVRTLCHAPGFTLVAILTLALAIGVNTTVFSIADSVLFRPMPFPNADRLFLLQLGDPASGETYGTMPGADVDAARDTGLFDSVGLTSGSPERVHVRRDSHLDLLSLVGVSAEYCEMLGLRPMLGRPFTRSDLGTRAVLLTYRTWMRDYGGDPALVGASLATLPEQSDREAQGRSLHVVGVLPPALRVPLFGAADGMTIVSTGVKGTGRAFPPLVRLKPDISATEAQARVSALHGRELIPGKTELRLIPLREELALGQESLLWLLLAAVTGVLIVACANLANLILARGSARARELAVRTALGAGRGRLVRMLFVEGSCIAALGTAAGLFMGYIGFGIFTERLPLLLANAARPTFDVRVLLFAIALACLSSVAFTVLPAIRLSRTDAHNDLTLARLQTTSTRRGRWLLVGVEVAICLALLVDAGLIGRSLFVLVTQDMGFGAHRVQARFDLPTMPVRRGPAMRGDLAARLAFMEARLADVRALPSVRSAAITSAPPFSGSAPDFPLTTARGAAIGGVYSVTSGYIRTMGMMLLAGRDIAESESAADTPVGVLNESAAHMLCGMPQACIGYVVRSPKQRDRTVVGVVRDARQALQKKPSPAMYATFEPTFFPLGVIVMDIDNTPAAMEQLEGTLSRFRDARVNLQSLDDARDRELSPFRFNALVVSAFAILTLVLAIVGVYGVMAGVVGERTREYGIRIALGATPARLKRFVVAKAAMPLVCGVIAGLMLAFWTSRSIANLLYGVVPLDGTSFGVAAAIVVVSGVLAAVVPARRAARVDPIIALRAE